MRPMLVPKLRPSASNSNEKHRAISTGVPLKLRRLMKLRRKHGYARSHEFVLFVSKL